MGGGGRRYDELPTTAEARGRTAEGQPTNSVATRSQRPKTLFVGTWE